MGSTTSLLRQQMLQQRLQLSEAERAKSADAIMQTLLHLPPLKTQQHIAAYWSHQHEVDLSLLIAELWQAQKNVYLPVLHPIHPRQLWFAPYDAYSKLTLNRYGIPEPIFSANTLLAPWELDVVLMPLVAFDKTHHRLGMGAGYYDRSFAWCRDYPNTTTLIGCAYQWQEVPQLDVQPWDIPLHLVITDAM